MDSLNPKICKITNNRYYIIIRRIMKGREKQIENKKIDKERKKEKERKIERKEYR